MRALLLALALTAAAASHASPYEELTAAIRAGEAGRVAELLASGVSAQATDQPAQSAPLLIAASRGKHEIAAQLLAHGAAPDPRYAAYYNASALMLAVNNRDLRMAELLLKGGAEVNLLDSFGDPALNWAIFYGELPLVNLLLAHGARTDLVGHGNAVEVAMRRGHQAVLLRLLEHRGERLAPSPAMQALLRALQDDDAAAVRKALAAGADANGLDETRRPVLARAAREGRARALAALLDAGAAVEALDGIGFSALMEATREGHLAIAQALHARGARLDHQAKPRGLAMSALHLAAAGGHLELIRWLAAQGAPLEAQDSEGATPLAWSRGDANKAAFELLLSLGAKPLPAAG